MKKFILKSSMVFSLFIFVFVFISRPMNSSAVQYSKSQSKTLVANAASIKVTMKCTYDDRGVKRWIASYPSFNVVSGLATNVNLILGDAKTYKKDNHLYSYRQSISAAFMYSNMSFYTDKKIFGWQFDENNPSKGLYVYTGTNY